MIVRLLNWPARRPAVALAIVGAVALISLVFVRRLKPDVSLQGLVASGNPSAEALDRVLTRFSAAEELLVLVSAKQENGPERLIAFGERLARAIADDPIARSQVASFNYRIDANTRAFVEKVIAPNAMFYLSDDEFSAAKQRLTREGIAEQFRRNEQLMSTPGPAAAAVAKAFMQDPLRLHEFLASRLASMRPMKTLENSDALLSPDGRSLLIRISGTQPHSDLEFSKELTTTVARLAQQANADGSLEVDLTGGYAIAAHSESSIRHDSIIGVATTLACLQVLFLIAYRKPMRLFALALASLTSGVLSGFAAYALVRQTITPLTAVIGGMLAGIGFDYSIHYITQYHSRRRMGLAPLDATQETIRTVGSSLVASWATSAIGFAAIAFASVKALRDFSIAGALGLAGAFACTLILMPAVLVLTDRTRGDEKPTSRLRLDALVRFVGARRAILLTIGIILMALPFATLIFDRKAVALESDLTVMHPRPNAPLDAQEKLAKRMGVSPGSLVVYLRADSEAKLVALAHDVQTRLSDSRARDAGITGTMGLATVLPDPRIVEQRVRETGPAYADQVLRDFDAVVAESAFSAEAFKGYRVFLRTLLTRTEPPTIATLRDYPQLRDAILPKSPGASGEPAEAITLAFVSDPMEQRDARDRVLNVLGAQLHDLPGATLTGMAVLSRDTEATVHRDLPRLLAAAMVAVALYLLGQFRSLRDTLLAFLPTAFSIACLLAMLQVTGMKLNLVNIVAIPILIGITVDYGLYLVGVARASRDDAERFANLSTTAQSVVWCASATTLGFGSLVLTSIPAVRSLGVAVSVGVIGCAVGALFLLVPLLSPSPRTRGEGVRAVTLLVAVLLCACGGCFAPRERLTFPTSPIEQANEIEWFDVDHDGRRDFALVHSSGQVDELLYDDDQDGTVDRVYRLSDYRNEDVPHVIILLDSIPFATVRERYDAGDFRWFDRPPVKLIAPFPSLTEVCFSDVLRAPPMPGVIDQYYDPRTKERNDALWRRIRGYWMPWERRCHYCMNYLDISLAFLNPRPWFAGELARAKRVIDDSPDRVTIVYFGSAAGMVCRYGKPGAEEVLDGARQLCLQLLHERHGAVKISMMADHGHNYAPTTNRSLDEPLRAAGFRPSDSVERDDDVVVEINGLVTNAGIHTRQPAKVAEALVKQEFVELVMYMQGDRVIVQNASGSAAIESRCGRVRYVPIDGTDVLGYANLIDQMRRDGACDADGFADDSVWFERTLDHYWPNAPRRVWDAMHRQVVNPPTVLLSIRDGFCTGLSDYEKYIKMLSTHGGLNQVNSATFLMTMTGRVTRPVRHQDVLSTLEPGYEPRLVR